MTTAEIEREIGLRAELGHDAGSRRFTPAGDQLSGHYKETYCYFDFGRSESLAQLIRESVEAIRDRVEFLTRLRGTGGSVEVYVSWFGKRRNFGESLDYELLRDLAHLGLDLALDVYAADRASTLR